MNLRAGTPARELGLVFVFGPALGVMGVLAAGASRTNLIVVSVLAIVAWVVAAVLLSGRFEPANPLLIPGSLFGSIALVSVAIVYGGSPGAGLSLFYLWTTPLAFILLPRRLVVAYVVTLALCYAGVIYVQYTFQGSPPRLNFGRWLYVIGTVCFVGAIVLATTRREASVETRFRRTFHDSPIGQTIIGADGRYVDVNEAFAHILGRPSPKLVGLHLREVTHPDDVAKSEAALSAAMSNKPERDFQKRYVRPDGSIRTASIAYTAIGKPGEAGRPLYAHVIDITDDLESIGAARARDAELAEARLRYTRQQEALAKLGKAALDDGEIPDLLQLGCELAVEVLGVAMCGVPRLVAGSRTLEIVAAAGPRGGSLRGSKFPIPSDELLAMVPSPATTVGPNLAGRMLSAHEDWNALSIVGSALILSDSSATYRLSIATTAELGLSTDDVGFLNAAASILGSAIARYESDQRRRELVMRLVLAQEDERTRIAGEIHDDSLQAVAASRVQVHRLRNTLAGEAEERAHVVENVLSDASVRLRDLLFRLSPQDIGARGGLPSALNELAVRTSTDDAVKVAVDTHGDLDVDLGMRILIYRTVQEALVNTLKHGAASHAWVTVERAARDVRISVRDDGRGFDSSAPPIAGHIGLMATRTRIDDAGGSMAIVSAVGKGTEIKVSLPVGDST